MHDFIFSVKALSYMYMYVTVRMKTAIFNTEKALETIHGAEIVRKIARLQQIVMTTGDHNCRNSHIKIITYMYVLSVLMA